MFKSLLPSAAAAFALLLMPATASAHTKLVSSTPAANSTVSKVTSVNLQFNEKIVASTLKTELVMTGMPGMANHAPMKVPYSSMMGKDGKSAMLMLKRPLSPGTYKVSWSAALLANAVFPKRACSTRIPAVTRRLSVTRQSSCA